VWSRNLNKFQKMSSSTVKSISSTLYYHVMPSKDLDPKGYAKYELCPQPLSFIVIMNGTREETTNLNFDLNSRRLSCKARLWEYVDLVFSKDYAFIESGKCVEIGGEKRIWYYGLYSRPVTRGRPSTEIQVEYRCYDPYSSQNVCTAFIAFVYVFRFRFLL
jgi:hypothetical protein